MKTQRRLEASNVHEAVEAARAAARRARRGGWLVYLAALEAGLVSQ